MGPHLVRIGPGPVTREAKKHEDLKRWVEKPCSVEHVGVKRRVQGAAVPLRRVLSNPIFRGLPSVRYATPDPVTAAQVTPAADAAAGARHMGSSHDLWDVAAMPRANGP